MEDGNVRRRHAGSFAAADACVRARPSYPAEAFDWLLRPGFADGRRVSMPYTTRCPRATLPPNPPKGSPFGS